MKKVVTFILPLFLYACCNCEEKIKIVYKEKIEVNNCKCFDTYDIKNSDIKQDTYFHLESDIIKIENMQKRIPNRYEIAYKMPVGLYQNEGEKEYLADYIEKEIIPKKINLKNIIPESVSKCNYYIVIKFDIDKNGFLSNILPIKENRKCVICRDNIIRAFLDIKQIKLKSFASFIYTKKINDSINKITTKDVEKHTEIIVIYFGKKYFND